MQSTQRELPKISSDKYKSYKKRNYQKLKLRGLKDIYEKYSKEHNDSIDKKTFCDVLEIFNKLIILLIINRNYSYIMPHLGQYRIRKREERPNGYKMDFYETKRLNKAVVHLNIHTDGYYYRFHWLKRAGNNICNFFLRGMRPNKRYLARRIKEGKINY